MEVLRALAALCEAPGDESARLAALLELGAVPDEPQWSELFLFQLVPYASVYLGADGRIGGEPRDRIAGFWRAVGLTPPKECDHLAVLLAFYAELAERQAGAADDDDRRRWRHVRRTFLWEHLLSWLPVWLTRLDELAPPFYRAWGRLAGDALGAEAALLPPPPQAPLHWRQAPRLADPRRDGSAAFFASLLTPLASGLLLARRDLERAGRDLDLGLRLGERRFILDSLFAQEAGAVLRWLGAEASRWRDRLSEPRADGLPPGAIWLERAGATAGLLTALAREAE